jgi:hypothetical protein
VAVEGGLEVWAERYVWRAEGDGVLCQAVRKGWLGKERGRGRWVRLAYASET